MIFAPGGGTTKNFTLGGRSPKFFAPNSGSPIIQISFFNKNPLNILTVNMPNEKITARN